MHQFLLLSFSSPLLLLFFIRLFLSIITFFQFLCFFFLSHISNFYFSSFFLHKHQYSCFSRILITSVTRFFLVQRYLNTVLFFSYTIIFFLHTSASSFTFIILRWSVHSFPSFFLFLLLQFPPFFLCPRSAKSPLSSSSRTSPICMPHFKHFWRLFLFFFFHLFFLLFFIFH